ncbi:MAG: AAA family ATPase [Chloroflexota bacterium]
MLIAEALQLGRRAFFKPFKLDDELQKVSPLLTTDRAIWPVRSGLKPPERRVVRQALVAIALGAVAWPLVAKAAALGWGYTFPWESVLTIALIALLLGVGGLLFVGLSFGLNMGPATGLAGSLAAIIGLGPAATWAQTGEGGPLMAVITFGLAGGLALGLILGLVAAATFTTRPAGQWFGGVCAIGGGALAGLFLAVAGRDANGLALGFVLLVLYSLGFAAGYRLGYLRLPLYLAEQAWQAVLTGLSYPAKAIGAGRWLRRFYHLSPARWDELIWFPLRTLDRQLTWLALSGERPFAMETINKIARSFRQGWAAEAALASILAHDLRDSKDLRGIADAEKHLAWLPRAVDLPSSDLQRTVTLFTEVSQSAQAATHTPDSPGWGVNLRKAQSSLTALQATLAQMDRRISGLLNPLLQRWQGVVEQALQDTQGVGPPVIENVYIFGSAIQPEKAQVFVGREDLFAKIQENLAASNKPTLVLYGQRRTGKTSLLYQLPDRLPAEYVPVFVDLQKTATVDGLNRFLYTLAREAVQQADTHRRLSLPPVDLDDFDHRGTHAFYEWLDQARKQLNGRLLLLVLDEFEKIEEAIQKNKMEEAVFDVLRHLVNHHSAWLVLLFAGLRTLEEMDRQWHSYFISVRPLRVSYLERQAAEALIRLPEKNSQLRYDGPAVEAILAATRAQPYLVQAVCFELIQYLNSSPRRLSGPFGRVTGQDAGLAVERALRSAHLYFSDLWANLGSLERLILAELAHRAEEWVPVADLCRREGANRSEAHQAIERLKQQEIIETESDHTRCRFQVPMVGQWILNEQSLEAVRLSSQELPETNGKRR